MDGKVAHEGSMGVDLFLHKPSRRVGLVFSLHSLLNPVGDFFADALRRKAERLKNMGVEAHAWWSPGLWVGLTMKARDEETANRLFEGFKEALPSTSRSVYWMLRATLGKGMAIEDSKRLLSME